MERPSFPDVKKMLPTIAERAQEIAFRGLAKVADTLVPPAIDKPMNDFEAKSIRNQTDPK